ncbi:MAG: iron ABC transporter permease [Pseudomonadota bacterium]
MQTEKSSLLFECVLGASLLGLALVHLQLGPSETTPLETLAYLWQDNGSNVSFAIRELRLPRILCAITVGASLALSGFLIQVVTRNPLGDPGLTGVSAGATFGVAVIITYADPAAWLIISAGIAGGGLAASLTLLLARASGLQHIHLLLAGLSVAIFFMAATSMVMVVERASMQSLYFWMIGGFANKEWVEFNLLWPVALSGCLASFLMAPILGLLQLDDAVSTGLGLQSGLWRLTAAAVSVVLAAGSVAVAGPIGFIGFVAPHIVRKCCRSSSGNPVPIGKLLILIALTGGTLTLAADLVSITLGSFLHAPAGIVVVLVGGACFLALSRDSVRDFS